MNSVEYIINNLKDLHKKFVQSNIRYEFFPNLKSHLIEITPKEFYDCDDYINEELIFEEKFQENFKNEDIVFVTSDSLNKINCPIFEVYSEQSGMFRTVFEEFESANSFEEPVFYSFFEIQNAGNNEFALAA
jgi:hypothetical protein